MNKLLKYNEIINKIDMFEGNSHFNDILAENNNNLDYSIYNLELIINRIIEDLFNDEVEEKIFYTNILKEIKLLF